MSATTLNGNIVGSVDVPSSGIVVAKDQLETPFDVTGLTELTASMKFLLPSVESGLVVVGMTVRAALQGGGDAAPSAPKMDVESPMIGQLVFFSPLTRTQKKAGVMARFSVCECSENQPPISVRPQSWAPSSMENTLDLMSPLILDLSLSSQR